MRTYLTTTILFCGLSSNVPAAEPASLADEADRINYSIGHQIGRDFKQQQVRLDEQMLAQGMRDGQMDDPPLLDKQEMHAILLDLKRNITNDLQEKTITRIQARKKNEEDTRAKGRAFMLENQGKEGVKILPSGLQYKVLSAGAGEHPGADDRVTIHYRASTMEGKEYDSSHRKGKPATYPANGVIPGFTEAIQMMRQIGRAHV